MVTAPLITPGESYAGVYVPNLAKAVVQGNAAGREPFINLKVCGNGNAHTACYAPPRPTLACHCI